MFSSGDVMERTRRNSLQPSLFSSWLSAAFTLLPVIACLVLFSNIQLTEAIRYPEQFLESVEVCAAGSFGPFGALARKKIRLANFPNNTVSLRITRWDDLYASFYNFRCKFQVTAPKSMGVMVVIQAMRMRTRKGVDCRDYIQFQQDDGFKTSKICGVVDSSDYSKVPERIIGPRKFYDPKGEMDVAFFTDGKDADEEDDPISLHLVFTAYKECTPAAVASNMVRQCSSLRSHSCISSALFCDGVINCGFTDDDFGADEASCGSGVGIKSREMDTEVDRTISIYVFAITTVATLVLVVILSLIVCCCLRRFAKQRRSGNNSAFVGDNPLHLHHQQTHYAPDIIRLDSTGPSAPLRSAEPSTEKLPVVDIDQPPPYDALFPSSKGPCSKPGKKQ